MPSVLLFVHTRSNINDIKLLTTQQDILILNVIANLLTDHIHLLNYYSTIYIHIGGFQHTIDNSPTRPFAETGLSNFADTAFQSDGESPYRQAHSDPTD